MKIHSEMHRYSCKHNFDLLSFVLWNLYMQLIKQIIFVRYLENRHHILIQYIIAVIASDTTVLNKICMQCTILLDYCTKI